MALAFDFEIFYAKHIFIHQSLNFYHSLARGINFNGMPHFTLIMKYCFIKENFLFYILFSAVLKLCIPSNEIFIFIQKMVAFFLLFFENLFAYFKMNFYLINAEMNCWCDYFLHFYFEIIWLNLFYLHFIYLMSRIYCSGYAELNSFNYLSSFIV